MGTMPLSSSPVRLNLLSINRCEDGVSHYIELSTRGYVVCGYMMCPEKHTSEFLLKRFIKLLEKDKMVDSKLVMGKTYLFIGKDHAKNMLNILTSINMFPIKYMNFLSEIHRKNGYGLMTSRGLEQ